jgi:hypothetical protein
VYKEKNGIEIREGKTGGGGLGEQEDGPRVDRTATEVVFKGEKELRASLRRRRGRLLSMPYRGRWRPKKIDVAGLLSSFSFLLLANIFQEKDTRGSEGFKAELNQVKLAKFYINLKEKFQQTNPNIFINIVLNLIKIEEKE